MVIRRKDPRTMSVMNGSPGLVSVILATDEPTDRVVRAVQSVLDQTVPAHEFLVWDRRGDHDTHAALQSLGGAIQYRSCPGLSLGAARNAAIRHSRGEWIALLDGDYVWTTDKLSRCTEFLSQHPECDIVYSPAAQLDASGRVLPPTSGPCPSGWMQAELFDHPVFADSAAVFRRLVWERFGGFDERLRSSVGHQFWIRVSAAHRVGVVDVPLAIQLPSPTVPDLATRADIWQTHAEMLHRYYSDQGGQQRLDRPPAFRTMGRVCLEAGRLAQQMGDWSVATRMYFGALHYGGTLRARLLFLYANWQRQRRNLPFLTEPRDAA